MIYLTNEDRVEILAIKEKAETIRWLEEHGIGIEDPEDWWEAATSQRAFAVGH